MVRQWVLVPPFEGSNPSALAMKNIQSFDWIFFIVKAEGFEPVGFAPSEARYRRSEAKPSSFRPSHALSSMHKKLGFGSRFARSESFRPSQSPLRGVFYFGQVLNLKKFLL